MIDRTDFECGWIEAIRLWEDGVTWEMITYKANEKSCAGAYAFARGMVASVDAMRGWFDIARREAKAHGVREAVADLLISLVDDLV